MNERGGRSEKPTTTSMRPYVIRALVDWICDNEMTPHLVAETTGGAVEVPPGYAKDGFIVLNISAEATQGFSVGADAVAFNARFNNVTRRVRVPIGAVRAVVARETGEGMHFPAEEAPEAEPVPPEAPERTRPQLRLVR